jgi:nickel transport protein
MKYKVFIIFSNIILLLPLSLYAHGVSGKVDAGGIVVSAEYDTGEPMSYARVKISAPGAKLQFQSGRTDRNGRFCFFPDTPGDWGVVVDDEMGHRLEVIVPVNEAHKLKTNQQAGRLTESSLARYERALIGISIIFGIFGCLLGWRGYKKAKGENL